MKFLGKKNISFEFFSIEKYPDLCSNVEFYCDGKCVSITHRCDDKPYCCKNKIFENSLKYLECCR